MTHVNFLLYRLLVSETQTYRQEKVVIDIIMQTLIPIHYLKPFSATEYIAILQEGCLYIPHSRAL